MSFLFHRARLQVQNPARILRLGRGKLFLNFARVLRMDLVVDGRPVPEGEKGMKWTDKDRQV